MYALRAWADYAAYIKGLRVFWTNERLEKDFQKKRYVDELRICLDNLADEFSSAVMCWPEFLAYRAELRAIFPNLTLRYGHFQSNRSDITQRRRQALLDFSKSFKLT